MYSAPAAGTLQLIRTCFWMSVAWLLLKAITYRCHNGIAPSNADLAEKNLEIRQKI
jgi:hypothetical protein